MTKPNAAQIALIKALRPFASKRDLSGYPAVLAGFYPLDKFLPQAMRAVVGREGARFAPLLPPDCAVAPRQRATAEEILNLKALAATAGVEF